VERQTRTDAVLDAASDLLLRVGYNRVTVEDVARQAGIGKGTVYLHWRTREDLFMAAFRRELARACDDLAAGIRGDPGEVVLHRVTRAHFAAVCKRPLLTALAVADPEVLGKLSRARHDTGHQNLLDDYLALLAKHALVRNDLDIGDLVFAWHALLEGFFIAQSRTRQPNRRRDHRANVLAATAKAAFEPDPLPNIDLADLSPQAVEIFDRIGDGHRAWLRQAYE